jgi:hypothetical protein
MGAPRILASFLSALRVSPRVEIARAVWSRAADLAEAVYYSRAWLEGEFIPVMGYSVCDEDFKIAF